ncbi:MAG TPA: packaged DNA stabilization protein [Caulobacteraceae bacterium]|nr:packaged DNA stabilization protein [Caulobacteraceae bacterium]
MPQGVEGQGSAPSAQIAQFRADGFSALTGMRIPFLSDAFARSFLGIDVRLENFISESGPLREERPYAAYSGFREIRYTRPGLVAGLNHGAGPIRGVFSRPGVFGGSLFIVSGTTIYRDGSGVGTIAGTDLVCFAASPTNGTSPNQIVAVAGGAAYLYDGVTLTSFTAIDNGVIGATSDVVYIAGRFIYPQTGTSRFYWSDVLDAASVDGANFAQTNDSAAPILAGAVLNDQLVLFTSASVEFWSANAGAGLTDAAFTPNQGRGHQRGCAARDTVRFADNDLFWLGDNGTVYRSGATPVRISSSSIEDAIRRCANRAGASAFVATFEGHEFYVLTLPGVGAYAYDISRVGTAEGAYGDSYARGEWAVWSSFGRAVFRGRVAAYVGGVAYVGDDTTNDVWAMTVGAWSDGTDPLVRTASAFIKIEEGRPRMDALICHGVTGMGLSTGQGSAPLLEIRWSDDLGRTFSRWRASPLGAQGDYGARARWSRLGQMRAPGRLVQVRCSEPVDVALSHLELNPKRPAQ